MKKIAILVFCLIAGLIFTSNAHAVVLTFEDLVGFGSMPDPYQGIINWEDGTWFYYDSVQPPYNPSSGSVRTFESISDFTPSWDFLSDVVYNGSFFSGHSFATVQMDLYLNGGLVHSTGLFAPSSTPTFFATNYNGSVDRVVINTPFPDLWVMDDLTYDGGQGAPNGVIPEPASMLLWAAGLAGAALAKRRKNKK